MVGIIKVVENSLIPFPGFIAINLFGVLFVRKGKRLSEVTINHEKIHTEQIKELGYVGFYIAYIIEWVIRLFLPGNAYRNISFEKEAYQNQHNLRYIEKRRHYAMWRTSSK